MNAVKAIDNIAPSIDVRPVIRLMTAADRIEVEHQVLPMSSNNRTRSVFGYAVIAVAVSSV